MKKNYFKIAEDFAMENFSNYGGDWSNLTNEDYNYAEGGDAMSGQSSLPYTINIANSTTASVSSVVILGANSNLYNASNFGNAAAITITMDNGDVTYTEFLEGIKSEPFKVGMMYLQSSNTSQPFKQLTLTHREPNGRVSSLPLTPRLDPYQNQSGVTVVNYNFVVNAFTKITTTILGSATLTMSLYPQQTAELARDLAGRNVVKPYSKPSLSQLQVPGGKLIG